MKKLYIVDDNLMMREFLRSYFEKEYQVLTFESGEGVLSHIGSNAKPDLLILDHDLNGKSGTEIIKSLKASGFLNDIPVLFLSGKQKSEIRISCLQAGAKDFISKPFNPVELSIKVKQHISSSN